MTDEARPRLRESREIEYEDGRRETIIVKRLSNTDLLTWVDTGFNKPFLVFRSIERAEKGAKADQGWFDTLTQDSAFEVVDKALSLNHSPTLQKKILGMALANLQSWLSAMPSSSSAPGGTTPTA
jgi:hypothetical protein